MSKITSKEATFLLVDVTGNPEGERTFGLDEINAIDIGGHGFAKSKKFRDAQHNPRVAFVVDDLASVSPWRPRGIEVRGIALVLDSGGEAFGRGYDPQIFRVRPRRIVSWGLEGERRSATVRP